MATADYTSESVSPITVLGTTGSNTGYSGGPSPPPPPPSPGFTGGALPPSSEVELPLRIRILDMI
jgi:hypothetical protein